MRLLDFKNELYRSFSILEDGRLGLSNKKPTTGGGTHEILMKVDGILR